MEITNNTEQSGKQKFTYIYKDIINEVSKAVNGIENNVKNIDDDEIKATSSDTIGILSEIKNYISDSLVELEEDSDWDTFTIAFYGETNAGKSTIIETLRLVLQEKTKLQEQQKFQETSAIISNLNAKLEKLNEDIVQASKDMDVQEDKILNIERERALKFNEYQKLLHSFRKERIEYVKKIKKGSIWRIPISTIPSHLRQRKEAKTALTQNRTERYKILNNKQEFMHATNNNLATENENKAVLEKIKGSLFIETKILNCEIQNNKECLQLNADGAIIGDGRSDNTRIMVRYEFDVDGKKFAVLDVPGIGGKEDDVASEIKKALRKTHVVFYVKSETKIEGGDTNTAGIIEKIKEQLGDQTQVYVVYNHRVTSPSQIGDSFLCDEISKSLAVLDSKMSEVLGKHYVKHIPLSAHFPFLAVAEKFVKDKWVNSRQKALDKLGKEDLFEKMGFTAFTDLIKKEVTENKEQKLIEANKNKITSLIKKAEEEVRNGQADFEKLYTKTTKLAQKASEEIDDAYDELSSRLSANINDAISTAKNNIRIDVYSYIEQNVDNDALKAELERLSELYTESAALQTKENGKESLADYLNNLQNALERFSRFMEEFSKKIFEDKLKMEMNINIKTKNDIKWLSGISGVTGIVTGSAVLIAATGGTAIPVLAIVVAVMGVVSGILAVWDSVKCFFYDKYKKQQQKKSADENIKEVEKVLKRELETWKKHALQEETRKNHKIKEKINKTVIAIKQQKDTVFGFKKFLYQQRMSIHKGEMFYG